MPGLPALETIDHVDKPEIVIWVALAFGLWLALSWLIRRLRLPTPVLVTATLSWIVAWLFIRAVPMVLHEIGSWPMH
jgi:Mg/Co/Ni transporter MgtE